ncbi:MAG TPA: FAD:protein FMN transferase [Armatimonadota bacterium]|nr:FAD:protein FMN transferase [Armatimonadota bacterium]
MTNPTPVILSLDAMATRFELMLYGDDPIRLRAAGEEALAEVERLETQLSLYRPESELTWINSRGSRGPVKVEPRLFRLLQRCADITARTDGTFDVTITPLIRAWGFAGGPGEVPQPEQLDAARRVVGMRHVQLNAEDFTIRFDQPGIELDLGGVGKGYAIECAANLLRENGITSAFLHGGTSTASAIGTPPNQPAWRVAIRRPTEDDNPLEVVGLRDSSLSVSAVQGKLFSDGIKEYGHVIDPRTGMPVEGALAAAAIGPSPTDCDALSTALLVLGEPGLPMLAERFPGYSGVVAVQEPDGTVQAVKSP